jgi:hypothetical protein
MNLPDIEVPSNRKFGFFFTSVFLIVAAYFFYIDSLYWSKIFFGIGISFFVVTVTKPDILFPLNKMWMKFGILLGIIISPIVMGIIFFGIFAPIAILMRLFGRDELRLRFKKNKGHWISRDASTEFYSFKNQF